MFDSSLALRKMVVMVMAGCKGNTVVTLVVVIVIVVVVVVVVIKEMTAS